ncbi:hypothetical protein M9H77_27787 [Catharanthus roseus]|uniref:Uncharacterized protein n=1 Tax=Catharanthus roseus TaxID=4058 RepID=A0ACC0AFN2_CATRO|nr:hypothetical protein M9H77_27787 [Catharanthus roseus]
MASQHVPPCIVQPPPSLPPPPPPPSTTAKKVCITSHPVHKTLATAANLANLLPTSTVLAFRTLIASFSNKGNCQPSNVFLTSSLIVICAVFCFFSSFTDSFKDSDGKLYYGGENLNVLMMNLPVGAGVLSTFLFVLFPTTRRGIGYADLPR